MQGHQQGRLHRKGLASALIRNMRQFCRLVFCGHLIQSSQKAKHPTEFKSCNESSFHKESQRNQMTCIWPHIFGKNKTEDSWFKSRVFSIAAQRSPKTIKVITISTKNRVSTTSFEFIVILVWIKFENIANPSLCPQCRNLIAFQRWNTLISL